MAVKCGWVDPDSTSECLEEGIKRVVINREPAHVTVLLCYNHWKEYRKRRAEVNSRAAKRRLANRSVGGTR